MTLYLGNLSYRVRENDLEQLLSEFGEVSNARVVMDRATGRSRGFGFADMADEDARRAIEALSEQEFEGRRLLIREAEDRPRREKRF
ncbi:RNA recognition motif domain-containing protein [uncultured Porphyromonas sp.]|uniref:RNA recognition motif domain-containing protein n=3 Tax=Porphyromonas sp. TaxID=1924944 RepID=UPI0026267DE2|nr:RNA-binding protein [uncultured Porphyromonas sp.]